MNAINNASPLSSDSSLPAVSPAIGCPTCFELFLDQPTLDAHRPKGASSGCLSISSLWARGWVRARSESKSRVDRRLGAIWSRPKAVILPFKAPLSAAAKLKLQDDNWACVLCKKTFASGIGFKAHQVHKFTKNERCLDAIELKSLHFVRSALTAVWALGPNAETSEEQIERLPSVRIGLLSMVGYETGDSIFNMKLDPKELDAQALVSA